MQGTYRHRTGLGRQYWCTVITSLKTTLRHPQCRHRSAFHHHHEPQPCSYTHREKREQNLKICDKCKIKITELSTLKNTNMGETCSPSTALNPTNPNCLYYHKKYCRKEYKFSDLGSFILFHYCWLLRLVTFLQSVMSSGMKLLTSLSSFSRSEIDMDADTEISSCYISQ